MGNNHLYVMMNYVYIYYTADIEQIRNRSKRTTTEIYSAADLKKKQYRYNSPSRINS